MIQPLAFSFQLSARSRYASRNGSWMENLIDPTPLLQHNQAES